MRTRTPHTRTRRLVAALAATVALSVAAPFAGSRFAPERGGSWSAPAFGTEGGSWSAPAFHTEGGSWSGPAVAGGSWS